MTAAFQPGDIPADFQLSLLSSPQIESPIILRPYQQTIKDEVYNQLNQGIHRILVYSPTGSGKTATFCSMIADFLASRHRVLLLMHREFLIEQTVKTLRRFGVPTEAIGIIKAGYSENRDRPLQLAGIQSLSRRQHPQNIDIIIGDEAHTICWYSEYKKLLNTLNNSIQIGFTASPWRLKPHKQYFGEWFDTIVKGPTIQELMSLGFLARVRYFGKGGLVDLTQLDTDSTGDFKTLQMEQKFLDAGICEAVRQRILELCLCRTGVIFNSGVKQSKQQTELLNEAGIFTKHIDAHTPINERRRMFQELEKGEIRCISSVGCLTEGFDCQSIGYVVLARATQSQALYYQVAGRGLRTCPGKENCLLLDFGGNVKRFGFLTKSPSITLEPTPPPNVKEMLKTCPDCGSEVWIFEQVCPECGYEFTVKKSETDEFEAAFGEMFDPETLQFVKYARSQRKARYTKKQNPEQLWATFKSKFPGQLLFGEWIYGAVFGGEDTPTNRRDFIEYLDKFAPTQDKNSQLYIAWMRHHLQLEFGVPGRENRHQEKFKKGQRDWEWWEILQINPAANWQSIKANYTELTRLYHPESTSLDEATAEEMMNRLNWALELAKLHSEGQLELFDKIEKAEVYVDSKKEVIFDNLGLPWAVKGRQKGKIQLKRFDQFLEISEVDDIPSKFHWGTIEDIIEALKNCQNYEQKVFFIRKISPEVFSWAWRCLNSDAPK